MRLYNTFYQLLITTWKLKVAFKTLSNFYDRGFLNISGKRSIVEIWQSPKNATATKTDDAVQTFNCQNLILFLLQTEDKKTTGHLK